MHLQDISAETWNKVRLSAIRIHESNNVNNIALLLLCISDKLENSKQTDQNWSNVVKNLYTLVKLL